jgi:hypothetical protein
LIGGIGLGIWLGVDGAALSLIACQLGAWALLPRRHRIAPGFIRMPSAFITTALIILSVQIDVLLAPRLLGAEASTYAASALPAKAVYLSLAATAWLVVPSAVKCTRLVQALVPISAVVGAGAAISAALALASPLIGVLLGQDDPVPALVVGLGFGMALAAGSWILVQIRMAKAPSWLWLAPAVAVVLSALIALAVRTQLGFCAGILVGQACGLAVGLVQLHLGLAQPTSVAPRRSDPFVVLDGGGAP